MYIRNLILVMILLILLINYSLADESKPQIPIYTKSSQTIFVTQNSSEFKIQLNSNPTTGYSWTTKQYDHTLLTLISYQYVPPVAAMPGAGGIAIWDFKAKSQFFIKSQSTHIHLLYARPWDLNDNPTDVNFVVTSRIN